MDFTKIIAELRAERQLIDEAILVLQRIAAGIGGKRRGRPPKWMSAPNADSSGLAAPKKQRIVSAAARKRMADSQKKRRAAERAQAKLATA